MFRLRRKELGEYDDLSQNVCKVRWELIKWIYIWWLNISENYSFSYSTTKWHYPFLLNMYTTILTKMRHLHTYVCDMVIVICIHCIHRLWILLHGYQNVFKKFEIYKLLKALHFGEYYIHCSTICTPLPFIYECIHDNV